MELISSVCGVKPRKKTFSPKAAKTPLVSFAKLNSMSADSAAIFTSKLGVKLSCQPVDGVERRDEVDRHVRLDSSLAKAAHTVVHDGLDQ